MQLFINNWASSLTLPATASAVQLSVPEADANLLTGLGTGDHYLLTLATLDVNGLETAWEVVRVTGHTAGVLDVLRAQEGTTALELEAATAISARLTQATMEELRDNGGPALSDTAPQALGAAAAGTSAAASRGDHVHALPTPAAIGAATAAQGATADTAVQPGDLATVATTGSYTDLADTPALGTAAATAAADYATAAQGALADGAIQATEKGAALGIATLDAGGKVPAAQMPSYVDDVLEFADFASLPVTGEAGKIYVTLDSNKTWRWGGSAYAEISASPGSTDAVTEGATNLYHTAARVRDAVLTGLSLATSTAVTATDSVLAAIGKLAARLALKEQVLAAGSNVTIDRTDPDNPIISASITGGGGGDVVGPASATNNEVALFDGITGKLLKGGGVLGTAAAANTGDFASAAQGALADAAIPSSEKGAALGVATLDAGGLVPAAQLPSYVDDVIEAADFASLPGTGESGKIYVTLDSNKTWRWGGSAYAEISASPGSTDAVTEGATNLYHTAARVLAAVLSGLSVATGGAIVNTDSVLVAFGKLQKQITDLTATVAGKQAALVSGTNIKSVNGATLLGAGDLAVSAAPIPVITETTTARVGALGDASSLVVCNNASASTYTVQPFATVPWPDATEIYVYRDAVGNLTLTAGAGVTIKAPSGGTLVLTDAMGVTLKYVSLNRWLVIGQTVAA